MALSLPAKVALGASTLAGFLALVLGGVAFEVSRARLISAYDQQVAAHAESVARHLGQMLRTIDRNLEATARNTMLANALTDSAGRDIYLAPFLKDFVEVSEVPMAVELRDYRGRPIAANPRPALGEVAAERVLSVIAAGRTRAWIDVLDGEPAVAMVAPVIYANTGLPEGALVYQFPLRALMEPDILRDVSGLAIDLRLPDRTLLSLGAATGVPADGITGMRMVRMPPSLDGFSLAIHAGLSRTVVDGGLGRLIGLYGMAALGVLALIVPVSVLMARGVLHRLRALEAAANRVIATGRMDARVDERGGDEIACLSTAFNLMLDRVRQAHEELERERAREVARVAERTRRILATTQEGYLLVAGDSGIVVDANQAAHGLLGAPSGTLIGAGCPAFLTPVVAAMMAPHAPASMVREVETRTPEGGRLVCLANASLDVDEHGNRCVFLFLTDISDRRAAEDALHEKSLELERSNADLQQFASAASHDLQEPLRVVTAYLKLLRERLGDALDDETSEFIRFASDGTGRMSMLIRDLLDYSRVGSRGAEIVPMDSGEALDEALMNLRVRIAEEGADIVRPPKLPMVMGDRAQIVRLFQNMIGNAIKFCAKERLPRVEIGLAEPVDGLCHLTVRDNGIGIDASFHGRIFEAFQRLHSRTEYEGTGLGLALVKRIVERHHGRVWVDSVPGEGATFHVLLPPAAEARTVS